MKSPMRLSPTRGTFDPPRRADQEPSECGNRMPRRVVAQPKREHTREAKRQRRDPDRRAAMDTVVYRLPSSPSAVLDLVQG
jgi:hypothetical protein